jgi:hypothetical protein
MGTLQTVDMTLSDRAASYKAFCLIHKFPAAIGVAGNWLYGCWVLGNSYQSKQGYHGEYPPSYLPRIAALFPDKKRILHLFSGKVNLEQMPGDTCDINPELDPTYLDDAQTLKVVPLENYDLIMADPPYSEEDADRYGTCMIKRNRVLDVLGTRLKPGTHVVWLDTMMPVHRKAELLQQGVIGIQRSTNHRFRCAVIFVKV